jgi:hypothetical protein
VGLFVATAGFSIGLDEEVFRTAGAGPARAVRAGLLSRGLLERFARAMASVGRASNALIERITPSRLSGQRSSAGWSVPPGTPASARRSALRCLLPKARAYPRSRS